MSQAGTNPEKELSQADRAYQLIRRSIIELEIQPGQSLSENGLAHTLKMSRTPVREALKRLATEGLIKTVPKSGTVVQGFDVVHLRHAVQLREVLESWAVRQAADDGKGALDLWKVVALQRKAQEAEDLHEYLHTDIAFHRSIAERTGNPKLVQYLDDLNTPLLRARYWALRYVPLRARQGCDEHSAIAEAIDEGDADRSDELMRTHIRNTFQSVEQHVLNRKPILW